MNSKIENIPPTTIPTFSLGTSMDVGMPWPQVLVKGYLYDFCYNNDMYFLFLGRIFDKLTM